MRALISFTLSQRLFTTLLALVLLGLGIRSYNNLAVDAFPDAELIYEANIETLEKMGHEGWKALDVGPRACPHATTSAS